MFADAMRVLRWALVVWGAVSLCGLAAILGFLLMSAHTYPEADQMTPAELAAVEREQIEMRLSDAGLGAQPLVTIEARTPVQSQWGSQDHSQFGSLQFLRVRAAGTAPQLPAPGWFPANRMPAYLAHALACMRTLGPDWMPSTSALASSEYVVHIDELHFREGGITDFDVLILQPSTSTAWLLQGSYLKTPIAMDGDCLGHA